MPPRAPAEQSFYNMLKAKMAALVAPAAPPAGFDALMQSTHWWATFRDFANAEFSGENVAFLDEVRTYRGNPSWAQLDNIYNKYIHASSPTQVNLPGEISDPLFDLKASPPQQRVRRPAADVFDDAFENVKLMVSGDTYRRFTVEYPPAEPD